VNLSTIGYGFGGRGKALESPLLEAVFREVTVAAANHIVDDVSKYITVL